MFTFTEDELQNAEVGTFNNGKAGIAENVKLRIEARAADAAANGPDFKLIAEDTNGNTVDKAFFELSVQSCANAPYAMDYAKECKKVWALVSKAVEHTGGQPIMDFKDQTDFLTRSAAAMGTNPVRIFVNFGSTRSPKDRLQIRGWQPFVESMATPIGETKLISSRIDQMVLEQATPEVSEKSADGFF